MDSEISTGYRELRTFLGTDWEHFIEQQNSPPRKVTTHTLAGSWRRELAQELKTTS